MQVTKKNKRNKSNLDILWKKIISQDKNSCKHIKFTGSLDTRVALHALLNEIGHPAFFTFVERKVQKRLIFVATQLLLFNSFSQKMRMLFESVDKQDLQFLFFLLKNIEIDLSHENLSYTKFIFEDIMTTFIYLYNRYKNPNKYHSGTSARPHRKIQEFERFIQIHQLSTLQRIINFDLPQKIVQDDYIDKHIAEFNYTQILEYLLYVSCCGSGGPTAFGYRSLEVQIAVPIYILLQLDRDRFIRDLKKGYVQGVITETHIDHMEWAYTEHGSYFEFNTDPITHKPVYRNKARFDAFFGLIKELRAAGNKKIKK